MSFSKCMHDVHITVERGMVKIQQPSTDEDENDSDVVITKEQAGMVAKWIIDAAKSIVDEP